MQNNTRHEPIQVVLVDDHLLFQQSLEALLDCWPEVKVIGKASSAVNGINVSGLLKPNVIIMDIAMNGMNGLETAPAIREVAPLSEILILSMYNDPAYVFQAFKAGCRGYVLKSDSSEELRKAIITVVKGRLYFSPDVATGFVGHYFSGSGPDINDNQPFALTRREQEICTQLIQRRSTEEIATDLCISPKTIRVHVANVMKKLSCRSRCELVLRLQQHNLDQLHN